MQSLQRLIRNPFRAQVLLATVAAIFVGIAYLILPERFSFGPLPNWILLAVEALFVVPLCYSIFIKPLGHTQIRMLRYGLQIVLIGVLIYSLGQLIVFLPSIARGGQLLRPAVVLWISNVLIFAQWYWELDGGGPVGRHQRGHVAVDFQFPQHNDGKAWAPGFIDYLFLAFNTATALSPTDTMPLTQRVKLLMMLESAISLLLIALVISRSVNII